MKKITCIVLTFLVCLRVVPVLATNDFQVSLHSQFAYLYDQATQIVYLNKGGNEKIYPASMTKILTVSLALDKIKDVHEKVQIQDEDLQGLYEAGASVAGFYAGELVTYEDLLYGALLPSGADACNALSRLTYGSTDNLVKRMNQLVDELNLNASHFTNVTGLHDDNHFTTPHDMALILHHALKNPNFEKVFNARTYTSSMQNHTWASSLQRGKNAYNLDISQIDGAKSGFTDEAQLTLASSMTIDGHQFILVTAYAKGQYTQNHVRDAIAICQYLHENYHKVVFYKKDEDVADYWVLQTFRFRYHYHIPESISLIVEKNLLDKDFTLKIDTPSILIAPMQKGDYLGTISIYDNQKLLYSYDMLITEEISLTMYEKIAYYSIIIIIVGGVIITIFVIKKRKNRK